MDMTRVSTLLAGMGATALNRPLQGCQPCRPQRPRVQQALELASRGEHYTTVLLRSGSGEVLSSHMLARHGSIRDTVMYSIIRPEWPAVRQRLERMLS